MGNALAWMGLLTFAGSTVVLGTLSQPAHRSNPESLIGWQNRFMILTYTLWLMVVAWPVAFFQGMRGSKPRSREVFTMPVK
jgi:hypothetical protein